MGEVLELIFIKVLFYYFMCVSALHACISLYLVCTVQTASPGPEEGVRSPGIDVIVICELSCGYWESNPGPVEEQSLPLTAVASLFSQNLYNSYTIFHRHFVLWWFLDMKLYCVKFRLFALMFWRFYLIGHPFEVKECLKVYFPYILISQSNLEPLEKKIPGKLSVFQFLVTLSYNSHRGLIFPQHLKMVLRQHLCECRVMGTEIERQRRCLPSPCMWVMWKNLLALAFLDLFMFSFYIFAK